MGTDKGRQIVEFDAALVPPCGREAMSQAAHRRYQRGILERVLNGGDIDRGEVLEALRWFLDHYDEQNDLVERMAFYIGSEPSAGRY